MNKIGRTGIPVSKFEQTTPSTTWVITHGLGRFVLLDVIILINGERHVVQPADIEHSLDLNTVTITFSSPQVGVISLVDFE